MRWCHYVPEHTRMYRNHTFWHDWCSILKEGLSLKWVSSSDNAANHWMADDDTKPSLLSAFWDLCPSSCGKGTILRLLEEFIASCVVVERFKHLDGDIEPQGSTPTMAMKSFAIVSKAFLSKSFLSAQVSKWVCSTLLYFNFSCINVYWSLVQGDWLECYIIYTGVRMVRTLWNSNWIYWLG